MDGARRGRPVHDGRRGRRSSRRPRGSRPSPSGPASGAPTRPSCSCASCSQVDAPLLLDADGLYALGDRPELLAERTAPTVLTPHEGELGRLLGHAGRRGRGRSARSAPAPPPSAATPRCCSRARARSSPTRRDAPTSSRPATPAWRRRARATCSAASSPPSSPRGSAATDAACLGAYLHGLAADIAAEQAVGTEGMVAGDLFQFLPAAIERLKAGAEEETHDHH